MSQTYYYAVRGFSKEEHFKSGLYNYKYLQVYISK
jgi:hypothetical protein